MKFKKKSYSNEVKFCENLRKASLNTEFTGSYKEESIFAKLLSDKFLIQSLCDEILATNQ